MPPGLIKFNLPRATLDVKGVRKAVNQASIDPAFKAALIVERDAKLSMRAGGRVAGRKTGIPSEPGTPPHVQTGNLRSSISTAVTAVGTIIVGPQQSAFYGRFHEFGGPERVHPERAFMLPALIRSKKKFKNLFRGISIARTREGRRLNAQRFKG